MELVNRAVLLVTRLQPYADWANQLKDAGDEVGLFELNEEKSVYLVPETEYEHQRDEILESVYADIFWQELSDWCTDESEFPKDRSLAVFSEWFEYELCTMVWDTADDVSLERGGD